jgi:hypothetical protein
MPQAEAGAAGKKRGAPQPVDPEEEEKRRKRAERFGTAQVRAQLPPARNFWLRRAAAGQGLTPVPRLASSVVTGFLWGRTLVWCLYSYYAWTNLTDAVDCAALQTWCSTFAAFDLVRRQRRLRLLR